MTWITHYKNRVHNDVLILLLVSILDLRVYEGDGVPLAG